MRLSAEIRPSNSIVFIHGEPADGWPIPIWGGRILATNSAVSVACFPEIDGPTEIVFGDTRDVGLDRLPDYEGILRTLSGEIVITTVESDVILRMPADELSVLKIWRSHPLWPDNVTIGIESVSDRWQAEQRMLPTEHTTVTSITLTEVIDSIVLSDGTIPSKYGGFNPWQFPGFLQLGLVVEFGKPIELTVATDALKHLIRRPDIDTIMKTPSWEVQVFDSHRGTALLKVGVLEANTRIRAWVERSIVMDKILIVLPARW